MLKQNKISISKIDAKNFPKLKKYIQKIKPDTIVHLAAVSHADRSNKNPKTFDNSFVALQNALEASKKFQASLYFFFHQVWFTETLKKILLMKKQVVILAIMAPKVLLRTFNQVV